MVVRSPVSILPARSRPRRTFALAAAWLALSQVLVGCPETTSTQTFSLGKPTDVVPVCVAAIFDRTTRTWSATPRPDCVQTGANDRVWGFVPNSEQGDIAIIDLSATSSEEANIDADPFIPGFTRIPVGGVLGAAVAHPDGRYLFVARSDASAGHSIDRFDTQNWYAPAARRMLSAPPGNLVAGRLGSADDGAFFLFVSLPQLGEVIAVEGATDDTFADSAAAPSLVAKVGGRPEDLVFAPANNTEPARLYVGQSEMPWLAVLDATPTALAPRTVVAFAPQCQDGLDNDSDGEIDGNDPSCSDPEQDDEGAVPPPGTGCADGLDNDGDGLIDFPADPGCASPFDGSEYTEAAECADGLDNDGDGLVDDDDPSCAGSAQETQPVCGTDSTYPCPEQAANLPACGNGLDDDMDGLADYADPDCYTRADASEWAQGLEAHAALALSPDGAFLYVTHRARRQVVVVRTDSLTVEDLNRRGDGLGNPLLAHERVSGVLFTRAPTAMAFAPMRALRSDGTTVDTQTAAITTSLGDLQLVDALVGADPVHLIRASTSSFNRSSRPELYVNGTEIEQIYRPATAFPHLGPFVEDDETSEFYGVSVETDPRLLRTETWELTHQGVLPNSRRSAGRLLGQRTNAEGETEAVFHDPRANFCALGVEPGDTLVLDPDRRLDCVSEGGAQFRGDRFELVIREVLADTLVVGPARFDSHCPGGTGSAPRGMLGVEEPTAEERFERNLLPTDAGERCFATELPHSGCFPGELVYEVRTPPGTFTVVGSRSGFLHPWESSGGQCVLRANADPRATGRAKESTPAAGVEPVLCGQFPLPENYFSEETPFRNFSFTLKLRPGCEPVSETELGEPIPAFFLPSPRDTLLRFSVNSSLVPIFRTVGAVPVRVRYDDKTDALYVVDPASNRITRIDPQSTTLTVERSYE
jgi:hypothetical protein